MMKTLLVSLLALTLNLAVANTPVEQVQALLHSPQATQTTNATKAHSPTLKDLSENYRFVVFFSSTCPHCHELIPVLQDFAHYYQVTIQAYSVDGPDLDGLHASKMTGQQYKAYFLQGGFKAAVPALFLQNIHTDQTYAVLFGEAKPYQLANRLAQLMKHIETSKENANEQG